MYYSRISILCTVLHTCCISPVSAPILWYPKKYCNFLVRIGSGDGWGLYIRSCLVPLLINTLYIAKDQDTLIERHLF